MSALPPIVFFGNDWFADNRTSSHHMARELARYTRVFYIGCPGLRAPHATARDARRLIAKLRRAARGVVRVSDSLAVRTLLQLPVRTTPLVRYANQLWAEQYVRLVLRRERVQSPVIWCTVPHVSDLVKQLPQALLVYQCTDDYAALPGVDPISVRASDEALTRASDIVFAASQPLLESKRTAASASVLLPHGVEFEHFSQAWRSEIPTPADIADIDGPVVGFFGLIEQWIDLELVGWLARELPWVTFVMIGRIAVPVDELPIATNLRFVGARSYGSLPAYGRRFDAALIPYKLTGQVLAANPLKLREYLAMGLPVISVRTPEIDRFEALVSVADGRVEFRDAIVRALSTGHDPAASARRIDAVRAHGWNVRAGEALAHVRCALEARGQEHAA